MKYLKNFELKEIKKIISKDFPNFKISSLKAVDNSWDNFVVEVNKNYIFRFAKDPEDEKAKNFETEVKLLQFLQNKISLAVPQIEYLGKEIYYTGYKKIFGSDLSKRALNILDIRQKNKLANDLARFLYEFHSALRVPQARKWGFEDEDLLAYSDMIKNILFTKLSDKKILKFVYETVKEYDTMIKKRVKVVFLYNDLHPGNLAFDKKNKKINGIFDFSDVMIGDINKDFSPLYRFDRDFIVAVAERYQKISGDRLSLRRMVIHARINELCDLAKFIDKPNHRAHKGAIREIRRWQKEKDIFIDKI